MAREPCVIYEVDDLRRPTFIVPPTFLFRLRNISFLLTTTLAGCLIMRYTLEPFDMFAVWKRELCVALVEFGRWPVICWMVSLLRCI